MKEGAAAEENKAAALAEYKELLIDTSRPSGY